MHHQNVLFILKRGVFIYLSRGVRAPIVYLKRVCSLGQACVFILSHQVFLNLPLN